MKYRYVVMRFSMPCYDSGFCEDLITLYDPFTAIEKKKEYAADDDSDDVFYAVDVRELAK